jgi:flagellar biosynthesis/type III secretory pathway protein FliH
MNSRLADNPTIHRWQVPFLDTAATSEMVPAPLPPPPPPPAPVQEPVERAPKPVAAPFEEIVPVVSRDLDADVEADALLAQQQRTEQAAQEGYAQGLERGLEEGRVQGYAEGHAEGRAAGLAQGLADGLAEGRRAGEQPLAEQARRLAVLVKQLAAPIPALERVVEDALTALALEVARAVIGAEVLHSRDYLIRMIREAVAKVPIGMGKPRLLMNFNDLELVRSLAPDIEENRISLVADETVEPGGCIVIANAESADNADRRWHPRADEGVSQIDLTLPSRWRAVMRAMFEEESE